MKTCTLCKIEKEESEFYLISPKNKKAYLNSKCKKCASLSTQLSLANHPETRKRKNEKAKMKRLTDLEWKNNENAKQRLSSYKHHVRTMLSNARHRAEKYKIEFNLTKEDIIIPELCPLLECSFVIGNKKNYLYTPTIDRIDVTKGYTRDNIRVITMLANSMKNNASFEQLLIFSKNIQSYIKI